MERFWSKVDKSRECWVWTAALGRDNNYGTFWFEGEQQPAHRVSYILTYGFIPEGLKVLHKCDNKQCVRPDHLFLGTLLDNNRDTAFKGRHRNCALAHPELMAKGEQNGNSKFTEHQVMEMRKLRTGGMKWKCLMSKFKISQGNLRSVLNETTWKHVK